MSKKLRLAPHACPAPVQPTDWDICALCQASDGTLINPSATGYASLATHLSSLCELNDLPVNINVSRLDDGDGIHETLLAVKLSGIKLATFCVMQHKWKEPESDNVNLVRN